MLLHAGYIMSVPESIGSDCISAQCVSLLASWDTTHQPYCTHLCSQMQVVIHADPQADWLPSWDMQQPCLLPWRGVSF